METTLKISQPEEQHGFRPNRRLEEHLVTANIFLDRTWAAGTPAWIVSMDLSKVFGRVHWPSLWNALENQGVSEHLTWLLHNLYRNQIGEVQGDANLTPQYTSI